jgi:hypothetical protein
MRDKLIFTALAIAGIALVVVFSVGDGEEARAPMPVPESVAPGPVDPNATLPEGHPPIDAPPPAAAAATGPEGIVLETIDGGGYTYVLLETDDGELWTAGPTTELEVGERVALAGAMQMGPFTSSALERDFDNLVFTNQYVRR